MKKINVTWQDNSSSGGGRGKKYRDLGYKVTTTEEIIEGMGTYPSVYRHYVSVPKNIRRKVEGIFWWI